MPCFRVGGSSFLPSEESGQDAERAAHAEERDVGLGRLELRCRGREVRDAEEEEGEVEGEEEEEEGDGRAEGADQQEEGEDEPALDLHR